MKSLNGAAVVAAWAGLWCASAVGADGQPVFLELSVEFSGYEDMLFVEDISGDGRTVVGYLEVSWGNYHGVQWDESGVAHPLPGDEAHLGYPYAALAVDRHGETIAGWSYDWDAITYPIATRWMNGQQPMLLGTLPGYSYSLATDLSGDGSTMVGYCYSYGGPERAYRWTAKTGMQDLGVLGGAVGSRANGISDDGAVVVGESGGRAFRWTVESGLQDLGTLPGAEDAEALAVSADGQVVVGVAGNRAFRWTSASGMEDLGTLAGDASSEAMAVSGNGGVVVGRSGDRAFLWRAGTGMIDLEHHLSTEYGIDTGWIHLWAANAVSDDGTTVTGSSWMVRGLPPGPGQPCPSDLDSDGVVGGSDIAILLALWGSVGKASSADLTGDGIVDGADLAVLLGSWGECP
jgi:probable HAF family extracellular repeat protein